MKTKLGSVLIAFFLLGVLLLPTANQWVHLSEEHHQEKQCTENSTHFHKKELACELIATFTSPFSPIFIKVPELFITDDTPPLPQASFENIIYRHRITLHLRGPPYLLFFT